VGTQAVFVAPGRRRFRRLKNNFLEFRKYHLLLSKLVVK